MEPTQRVTNASPRHPQVARSRSPLVVHTNAILRMRYQEKTGVEEVRAWLGMQNAACARKTLQKHLHRVLTRLDDRQAAALGVDLGLLRAVRRRLGLPLNPTDAPKAAPGSLARFDARGRQRGVWVRRRPEVPAAASPTTPAVLPGAAAVVKTGRATAGPAAQPVVAAEGGPAPRPRRLHQWHEVHRQAIAKLPSTILPNWHGTVMDMETDQELTAGQLRDRFGLSPVEAESLFLTL